MPQVYFLQSDRRIEGVLLVLQHHLDRLIELEEARIPVDKIAFDIPIRRFCRRCGPLTEVQVPVDKAIGLFFFQGYILLLQIAENRLLAVELDLYQKSGMIKIFFSPGIYHTDPYQKGTNRAIIDLIGTKAA